MTTPFAADHPWRKTPEGSLETTVTIVLNPSGMARFKGQTQRWVMKNDEQVIGNITELLKEGRRQLAP